MNALTVSVVENALGSGEDVSRFVSAVNALRKHAVSTEKAYRAVVEATSVLLAERPRKVVMGGLLAAGFVKSRASEIVRIASDSEALKQYLDGKGFKAALVVARVMGEEKPRGESSSSSFPVSKAAVLAASLLSQAHKERLLDSCGLAYRFPSVDGWCVAIEQVVRVDVPDTDGANLPLGVVSDNGE